MIILVLISSLLFISMLSFYESLNLQSGKNTFKRLDMIGKLYEKESFIDKINTFFENLISRFSENMDKEEKKELIEKLQRAGMNISYERYVVERIVYPIIVFFVAYIVSLIFIKLLGSQQIAVILGYFIQAISIVLAIAVFFDYNKKIERTLEDLREGIITEMPSFLATYRYSPDSKAFIDIVRDFNKNAKFMKYDLSLLIVDIDQYGTEKALKLFSQRVDILEVQEAVSIFINDLSGSKNDSKINLEILENKFLEIVQNKIKDSLKDRPFILESLNVFAITAISFMFVAVLAYQVYESFIKLR